MNFLAHFHLAWPDEGLLVGALEGDYYKGRLSGRLPPPIERGVALHRAIDAYTDTHEQIRELRRQISPPLRRYAGILIDLSFDHYLCVHWSRFAAVPQPEFNTTVYDSLERHAELLSADARRMLARLREYDLLARYRDWQTVSATAARIGARWPQGNPLRQPERALSALRPALEAAFLDFYPDLRAFSAQRLRALR